MRHVLTSVLLILAAFPAAAADVFTLVGNGAYEKALDSTNDPLLRSYVTWASLRHPEAATPIPFGDGYTFLSKHPGWPDEKIIRLRTEQAALDGDIEKDVLRQFCTRFPPISGRGMFACARGGVGTEQQRKEWVKQGWLRGDFSEYEEEVILGVFGTQLGVSDHIARIDRLLFDGKTSHAERMLKRVPRERETLYRARIALISNARDANARLNAVPVNLRHDPGLILDRIRWRARRDDTEGVRELLLNGPKDPPYADAWWRFRSAAVREALASKHYKEAVEILARRGELKAESLADALFLRGWIALAYLTDTHGAYRDFYALYTNVTTPVSRARAAYWAAEAARLNGNNDIMRQWLEKAASHPLTFYGQLAFVRLHPNTRLPLPPEPSVSKAEEAQFLKGDQVRLTKLLTEAGEEEMANRFLVNLASQAEAPAAFVLLARLAREVQDHAGSVRVAKQALRKGVVLVNAGWPVIPLPKDAAIEPALALAITRQESEFDTEAESTAGARGLMQLLPRTAREVARKREIKRRRLDLDNPELNIVLGTAYLSEMIESMNGSYVLGIAAYNAGPGNVYRWQKELGPPGTSVEEAVHWIENIPFAETRNYVMRVLENLQIYRQLSGQAPHPEIMQDMTR